LNWCLLKNNWANGFKFPCNKKIKFAPEIQEPDDSIESINEEEVEEEQNFETIIDKSIRVSDKGFGFLLRKYLHFPDNKFGIHVWYDEGNFYIGSKDNKFVVDGNDLIINNERYKGTHGFRKLLTIPNKKKLDKDTYESWLTNTDNFTEKDLNLYKEILKKTHSIYRNNDP
jgi:phosphoribosylaminoimidazole-succinocarboxamide synthase